ncbi:MAG TPA: N,N-dimethylformamidase beta subunit family domain-containing protein [Solirubrobacteraceae bacterium]
MLTLGVLVCALLGLIQPIHASAAVTCPNANPIVNENNCKGAGSSAWQIGNGRTYDLGGFATQTSYNLGQGIPLKIGAYADTVDIQLFRIGYYGGKGGRLISTVNEVPVNNGPSCNAMNAKTGEVNCENWETTYTIPAATIPATGVYIAKLTDSEGDDNQIIFVVREDTPTPGSEILAKIPTSTYQAYNWFGGKSLYNYNSSAPNLANGSPRAFSVSFERPFQDIASSADENWFFKVDYPMIYWLEKEGYNVSYTDGVGIDENPESLLKHKVVLFSGHDEYWSGKELTAVKNAREHGVSLASFGANDTYWKVEYENNHQRMTVYKTVQDGSEGVNDPGTESPTTTFRDPGAPAGSLEAPKSGRPGPNTPENSLWGIMYMGDTTTETSYGLTVPPAEGQDQYSGDSIWRNTGINPSTGATIGTNLVGWEWDVVPSQPGYLAFEPGGVIQVAKTNVTLPGTEWLQDYGREYGSSPPPGQAGFTEAVKYRAASGALVFAAGTMQWSWGLGPHFLNQPQNTYSEAPVESADSRIQQATYNILSEMGVQPQTPVGVVLDGSEPPPSASFSTSPQVITAGQSITLNASSSYALSGAKIVDYKWDLKGTGEYTTDAGTSPTLTHEFPAAGSYLVGLKVTDSRGQTATTTRTLNVGGAVTGVYPQAVLATPGLAHFWRLDESSGSSFADIAGGNAATITGLPGAVALNQTGALTGNTDTASAFDGASGSAQAAVNLSGTNKLTVEFWLKWNKYENNDSLAMEFTPNFNLSPGGFLIDPNAPQQGGEFGVGIGNGSSRNNVYFARPSAGAWHYYTFVIDTGAAGSSELTPYVDGRPVSYTKTESGTGAGNFASSTLSFMSRNDAALFGAGTLDEVALYEQALSSETILQHYELGSGNSTGPNPTAAFTNTPSPVKVNQPVTFDGSSSTDPDGAIVDYKWDLDGSGTYATDTGSTPTVSHSFTSSGPVAVSLKITDSNGQTATVTRTIEVQGPPTYAQEIEEAPGLSHYWRMDETSGSTFADLVGGSPATIDGAPGAVTLGVPGALSGVSDTAASFDGTSGAAQAQVNLSATNKLTIEFWLKWNKYENNDSLAMELTPNFNNNAGGFLVDPNAPEEGGEFAVAIGTGGSRNNVYFPRPSAGVWHYYAFVIDTNSPGATEITPFVDGQPVTYTKTESRTGAGPFANSTLNFMSRNASALFGAGSLDDVALYNETLAAAAILNHYRTGTGQGVGSPPTAVFKTSPSISAGQETTLDASTSFAAGSATITDYKWDLNGSGEYATDAGASPTLKHIFTTPGSVNVSLKVTDSNGQSATVTHTIAIGGSTTTAYAKDILETPGVSHYWRMGEGSGTTLVDAAGNSPASIVSEAGSVALGQPGALIGESDTAAGFDGIRGAAQAQVNLSVTSKLTVEFWLNWSKYENNDSLAMEFTPNFNSNTGGFLIDPNAPEEGGKFGVAIGTGGSRNNVFFARPSAGAWHYYSFVIDTTAAGESEITPYIDGEAVPYTKTENHTGAGNFANSTLNFMSRNASALFGAGGLDEVALYSETLTPATILQHYETGIGKDTTPPSGGALSVGGTIASKAGTTGSNTTGSLAISRTDYSEEQAGNQSGLASSTLTVANAPYENGNCGTFGTPTTIAGSPTQTVSSGCYSYTLTGTDNAGNSAHVSTTIKVDTTAPTTPSLAFGALSPATYYNQANNTLYFNPASSGEFTVTASSTDPASGIAGYTFSPLATSGFAETQTDGRNVYAFGVSAKAPSTAPSVSATNGVGSASANATYNLVADSSVPTGGALTVNGVAASAAGSTSFAKAAGFTIGTRTDYNADTGSGLASSVLTRAAGTLSKNTCGSYAAPVTISGNPAQSGLTEGCYLYTLTGTDKVGNTASLTSTVKLDPTPPAATVSVPADANGAVAVTFSATDAGSGVNTAVGQLKRATATYTASNDTCGVYGAFANVGAAGASSPFSDTTVTTAHCYEYEYTVSDLAGNATTSAIATVKVNTTKPALTGITDTTPGTTAGLPQVGDAITLQFSDTLLATSIPSSVTLTYARSGIGATALTVSGLSLGNWSAGDSLFSPYSKTGGTSAVVTATTLVGTTTITLTVSSINDPSKNLTAGGPGSVSGTVNAAVKDIFGNTASTSSFTTSSIRLF